MRFSYHISAEPGTLYTRIYSETLYLTSEEANCAMGNHLNSLYPDSWEWVAPNRAEFKNKALGFAGCVVPVPTELEKTIEETLYQLYSSHFRTENSSQEAVREELSQVNVLLKITEGLLQTALVKLNKVDTR